MSANLRALMLISLAAATTVLIPNSYAQPSDESEKAAIMKLNERVYAAFDNKDLAATMACFSDDSGAIFFEPTIPFQMNKTALAKDIELLFESVSALHTDISEVNVQVSGDLAAVYLIQQNTWTDATGTHTQTARYTQVDRKEGGRWLIWHEHLSLPYNPGNGRAVMNAIAIGRVIN